MPKITIYTTTYCPYCINAKELLKRRGIPFTEVLLSEDDDTQWDALSKRSGMQTVPQIFSDDQLIGGYRELAQLDRKDQLSTLK